MFNKKIKMNTEEFKKVIKDIELEVKKEQEQKMQEFKIKYFTLKEKHENLEKSYIKIIQENDILKSKIQELSSKQEEDTLNTLSKFENLDRLLGDE